MELDTEKIIKLFYEKIKEDYPKLSFEQIREICKSPFRHIANQIAKDNLPTILVKYFGTFEVHIGKIKNLMTANDTSFKFNKISEETHRIRKEGYESILNELESKPTKIRIINTDGNHKEII